MLGWGGAVVVVEGGWVKVVVEEEVVAVVVAAAAAAAAAVVVMVCVCGRAGGLPGGGAETSVGWVGGSKHWSQQTLEAQASELRAA